MKKGFLQRFQKRLWPFGSKIKALRRTVRYLVSSPRFGCAFLAYSRAIQRGDWVRLKECLMGLSADPSSASNGFLVEFSEAAQRIGETECSISFLRRLIALQSFPLPLWDGRRTEGTVHIDLAETSRQGVSHAMLATKHVSRAVGVAGTCRLYCEPRLVPILSRSFPSAEVCAKQPGEPLTHVAGWFANLNLLRVVLDTSYAAMDENPGKLVCDADKMRALRAKYEFGGRPIIGISWSSPHSAKQLPSNKHWARLMSALDANFVSLQFMPDAGDLASLASLSGKQIIVDSSVDQRLDLDCFAAQIAAMDVVVSISNTTAHLAGSLGVPLVVVRDDAFQWVWDVNRRRTAWYSSARIVRRNGRNWRETFDSVEKEVVDLLPTSIPSNNRALG